MPAAATPVLPARSARWTPPRLIVLGAVLGVGPALPASHAPRPRAFRLSLGGAGINLASGLLLGVPNLSEFLLPSELLTPEFLRNVVIAAFAAGVAAAIGLLLAFCGIAATVRQAPTTRTDRPPAAFRVRRGKSIYRGAPSAR